MCQETSPRRIKEETPLHELRRQRVSKAKRFPNASAKSLSGTIGGSNLRYEVLCSIADMDEMTAI
jgi:hypothetical protein